MNVLYLVSVETARRVSRLMVVGGIISYRVIPVVSIE